MKKFMLALATFLTFSAFAPSYADEISVMFQPDGGVATDAFGVAFSEDEDGTTLMSLCSDDEENRQKLIETIDRVVKNGISGSITAIFSFTIDNPHQKGRSTHERVLLFGDFTKQGRYFLWGYTHQGRLLRWYVPEPETF